MSTEPAADPRDAEISALQARMSELEAELAEQARRTAATVAEAQEKLYWLERWHVDLDKVMAQAGRGPGARGAEVGPRCRPLGEAHEAPTARKLMRSVSVVVPVKDGARYLQELLEAVVAQEGDAASLEVLVIDSGSVDAQPGHRPRRGRAAPGDPGGRLRPRPHPQPRRRGDLRRAHRLPHPGRDARCRAGSPACQAGFDLAGDVGAVYGPHRPRPDTSPMIARELDEFFATHEGPHGGPAIQRDGDQVFLSNVNAAYRRDCWEALRFPDVPYSEDQAFARAMLEAGWAKAYVPQAAVLHAHDYPPAQFMRRYFDEYRGLRSTLGHVEAFGLRSTVRDVRALVAADRAWMAQQGVTSTAARRWTGRSTVHHTGRKVFSAMGSRAHALPPAVQRRLSLEGTVADAPPEPAKAGVGPVAGKPIPEAAHPVIWDAVRRYAKQGPTSCSGSSTVRPTTHRSTSPASSRRSRGARAATTRSCRSCGGSSSRATP